MVDSTVAFVQKDFLQRITEGWDVSRARTWFVDKRQKKGLSSGLMILTPAITNIIVENSPTLPPTFTLDYIRLRALQEDFESLMSQAACRWTLEKVLSSLKSRGSVPQIIYDRLFARVCIIRSPTETKRSPLGRASDDITLEIVRMAYNFCGISNLPSTKDIEYAQSKLEYCCDDTTSVYKDLQLHLAEDLQIMVDEEVHVMKNLTPMQVANRYVPEIPIHPLPPIVTEKIQLRSLAQRIAHISVLHWRVWGPILYEQPDVPGEA